MTTTNSTPRTFADAALQLEALYDAMDVARAEVIAAQAFLRQVAEDSVSNDLTRRFEANRDGWIRVWADLNGKAYALERVVDAGITRLLSALNSDEVCLNIGDRLVDLG